VLSVRQSVLWWRFWDIDGVAVRTMSVEQKKSAVAGNTIVYQSFLEVLRFAWVFRTTSCYARELESLTMLENVGARIMSSVTQSISFDMVYASECQEVDGCLTIRGAQGDATKRILQETDQFKRQVLHCASLLHALMLLSLREQAEPISIEKYLDAISMFELQQCFRTIVEAQPKLHAKPKYFELPVFGGLLDHERRALCRPKVDPVLLALQWLMQTILNRSKSGGLKVEGPTLAAFFLELTQAYISFGQLSKLAIHPYPFPYTQVFHLDHYTVLKV
jgi:hypothetical protein